MSDLSLPLQQAASQLPVPFYFDEALLAREKNRLFDAGPRYVGHALAVSHPGDYFTLPQPSRSGAPECRGSSGTSPRANSPPGCTG